MSCNNSNINFDYNSTECNYLYKVGWEIDSIKTDSSLCQIFKYCPETKVLWEASYFENGEIIAAHHYNSGLLLAEYSFMHSVPTILLTLYYDDFGNLSEKHIELTSNHIPSVTFFENQYDVSNQLLNQKQINFSGEIEREEKFKYIKSNLVEVNINDRKYIYYEYDSTNSKIIKMTERADPIHIEYEFEYLHDLLIQKRRLQIINGNSELVETETYSYDELDSLASIKTKGPGGFQRTVHFHHYNKTNLPKLF